MTAGNGIVHEEYHSEGFTQRGGILEMVQLWVNLPAKEKSTPPKYQDLRYDKFPQVPLENDVGKVRVIAGEFDDSYGPASTFTPMNVWDVEIKAGGAVDLKIPDGHTCVLVVQQGSLWAAGTALKAVELALFERRGNSMQLKADTASRALVLTGQPLKEPVVGHGPFVMNNREEIQQAIRDYQDGKMGALS